MPTRAFAVAFGPAAQRAIAPSIAARHAASRHTSIVASRVMSLDISCGASSRMSLRRVMSTALTAVVVLVSGTFGSQTAWAQDAGATAATKPLAPALSDAAYAQQTAGFDARQQVLNARTSKNEYAYAVAKHDCYATFFVNHCLDRARDTMRDEKEKIRELQLALSTDRRGAREQKREADDAQRLAQQRANAPQRAANEREHRAAYQAKQQQNAVDRARRGNDTAQRQANADAYNRKQAANQQKLDAARANAAADAQKRAENVQRYQSKQADAAARQQALDQRREDAAKRAAAASDTAAPGK